METNPSRKAVSRSQSGRAPIPKPNKRPRTVADATKQKAELRAALGDFSKQEEEAVRPKQSLLSDEGNVLHVGKEERGTIITDVKRDSGRLPEAVKETVENWYAKTEKRVKKILGYKPPKKNIAATHTRIKTIKRAAAKSSLPSKNNFKVTGTQLQRSAQRRPRSSVRIKDKNIPEEIGETKPHWTHVAEEAATATSPQSIPKKATIGPISAPDHLLESPRHKRRLLESPEDHRPQNVQKVYRPVTTAPAVKLSKPAPKKVVPVAKPALERVVAAKKEIVSVPTEHIPIVPEPRKEKLDSKTPEQSEVPEPVLPTEEPITANKPARLPEDITDPGEEVPALPIVTIVLVIIFIVVLALSTTLFQ